MPQRDGDLFAGYTILRLLGSGGMGEVYLAQHPRLPRRDALKILPPRLTADSEFRQRFNREADLAAGLWHPHIVGIHDRGEFQGQLWISMDYVEGTDAAQLLRSRYPSGMPPAEVCEIVTAVAEALDYAHSRGLLHRDVKPANILLGPATPRRRILLADFGIAKQLDDVSGLTATNMLVGTTGYCAPEQLQGAEVGTRADQYALGCTAFHLLTGKAPFHHSNPAVVISQHISAPPPWIGEQRPDLARLNSVIARALAKNPDDRYPSCSDFAAALSEQSNTGPAATVAGAAAITPTARLTAPPAPEPPKAAPPETTPPNAAPPKERRCRLRAVTLISALAAVVLIAAATVVGVQLLRAHSGHRNASAASASAPPIQLSRYITDQSGVLTAAGRAAEERALQNLYAQRNVHLWVAYVNSFAGLKPFRWAEETMRANGFTDTDALLAVATDDRHFSFRVPAAVTTPADVEAIRRNRIEPAVSRGEWARAAVAAANGLETAGR